MAKKLKVFRTSIGFFELAVAAPSMKAAAEAWGSDPDIFRRGFAEQTEDAKVVEAAMAAPGVVLRRPVGSDGKFSEKAKLPDPPRQSGRKKPELRPDRSDAKREPDAKAAVNAEREAAAARDKEEKRQALEREKRAAEEERARKRREQMIARADAAFEKAKARHDEAMQSLARRRSALADDEAREHQRWEGEKRLHKHALKEAEA